MTYVPAGFAADNKFIEIQNPTTESNSTYCPNTTHILTQAIAPGAPPPIPPAPRPMDPAGEAQPPPPPPPPLQQQQPGVVVPRGIIVDQLIRPSSPSPPPPPPAAAAAGGGIGLYARLHEIGYVSKIIGMRDKHG